MTQPVGDADTPTGSPVTPVLDPPPPGPIAQQPWFTRADIRFALGTIGVLLVAGAIAGVLWRWWAHTPTRGLVYTKTAIIPDQTEGFISSDGRFVVITAVIGLVAGLVVWLQRSRRGPIAVAGLVVGAVAGAAVTDLIGYLLGGGTTHGKVNTVLPRLPLQVHAIGCLFIEALLAAAVYVISAAFINPDDLGRSAPPPEAELEPAG